MIHYFQQQQEQQLYEYIPLLLDKKLYVNFGIKKSLTKNNMRTWETLINEILINAHIYYSVKP